MLSVALSRLATRPLRPRLLKSHVWPSTITRSYAREGLFDRDPSLLPPTDATLMDIGNVEDLEASLMAEQDTEYDESLASQETGKRPSEEFVDDFAQSIPHRLGNARKHSKADYFDWGTIKSQVFGDFGKPGALPAIQRISFVPEPSADETVELYMPETEMYSSQNELMPRKSRLPLPMLPQARPVKRVGRTVSALGRRKRASASVRMTPGTGIININGRHWMYYFKDAPIRNSLLEPLILTEYLNKWDIHVQVQGGGFRGQAGAIRLAIARALLGWDPELHPPLRQAGYLTRDKREVERKKPGKRKARRSFQWVKR